MPYVLPSYYNPGSQSETSSFASIDSRRVSFGRQTATSGYHHLARLNLFDRGFGVLLLFAEEGGEDVDSNTETLMLLVLVLVLVLLERLVEDVDRSLLAPVANDLSVRLCCASKSSRRTSLW